MSYNVCQGQQDAPDAILQREGHHQIDSLQDRLALAFSVQRLVTLSQTPRKGERVLLSGIVKCFVERWMLFISEVQRNMAALRSP